ncbi:c-type cytochrome [Pseudoalteromonas sp. T1lg88]|uniref:c-type cytochrome n=2 Tax=unclassified Pseudoalteromonas TaxID=194690 RepID=UPI001319CB81|nr:c-type cytochrome [Pseudoalteromonas sp. T1lg88]
MYMKYSYFILILLLAFEVNAEPLAARCQSCHGLDGIARSADTPHLKGQHVAYLRQQLLDYRARKRRHALMSAIAASLTEQQIDKLARFYGQPYADGAQQADYSADK